MALNVKDVTAKAKMSVGLSPTFVYLPVWVDQSGGVIYSWHDCAESGIMCVVMVRGRIYVCVYCCANIWPAGSCGENTSVGCDLSLI